jgi:TPP-dependent pyruvate/acetoin dehydrogenase alpha subunit
VRPGIENDLAEWEKRDPLKRMAERLIDHNAAMTDDLERLRQEEESRLEETFKQVLAEVK